MSFLKKNIADGSLKLAAVCLMLSMIAISGCTESNKKMPDDKLAASEELDDSFETDFDIFEEEYSEKAVGIEDPLEGINRIMFGVNDTLYFWVVKPVAEGYEGIVPGDVRLCIGNFFQNLGTPARFVNCHLQGNVEKADIELQRFLINTTFGIAGFGDPAKDEHNLPAPPAEDLGQTLAVYGIDDGWYLVLPLLGPSTTRDAAGKLGDLFLNPLYYLDHEETLYSLVGTKYVNIASQHTGEYEKFKKDAVDPYVAMRDIYLQYRKRQIEE